MTGKGTYRNSNGPPMSVQSTRTFSKKHKPPTATLPGTKMRHRDFITARPRNAAYPQNQANTSSIQFSNQPSTMTNFYKVGYNHRTIFTYLRQARWLVLSSAYHYFIGYSYSNCIAGWDTSCRYPQAQNESGKGKVLVVA
jgi:hypothetical protein